MPWRVGKRVFAGTVSYGSGGCDGSEEGASDGVWVSSRSKRKRTRRAKTGTETETVAVVVVIEGRVMCLGVCDGVSLLEWGNSISDSEERQWRAERRDE